MALSRQISSAYCITIYFITYDSSLSGGLQHLKNSGYHEWFLSECACFIKKQATIPSYQAVLTEVIEIFGHFYCLR